MPSKKNLGDRVHNRKLDPDQEKRKDSEPAGQTVYFVPEYELSVKAPSIEAAVTKAKRQRETEKENQD